MLISSVYLFFIAPSIEIYFSAAEVGSDSNGTHKQAPGLVPDMSLLLSRYLAFLSAELCFVAFGSGSGNPSNNLQISISGNAILPGSTAQSNAQRGDSDGTTVDVTSSVK